MYANKRTGHKWEHLGNPRTEWETCKLEIKNLWSVVCNAALGSKSFNISLPYFLVAHEHCSKRKMKV